jgi:uncharacterized protein YjbJ (UPF0337 family)
MNRDRFEGVWKQVAGKVREGWFSLTDDVPGMISARRYQRAGWIQEGRGISKESLQRQNKDVLARSRDWNVRYPVVGLIECKTRDRVRIQERQS